MEHRGVVITAGFNRSKPALLVAELLRRENIAVQGVLVVTPYSFSRARKYLKKRGWAFFIKALFRMIGIDNSSFEPSPEYLDEYIRNQDVKVLSLKKWAEVHGCAYHSVSSLNNQDVLNHLKGLNPSWLIYSGGGILKEPLINEMEGRILNAHQGPLPEIRGMNACEWSVLLGQRLETTIHLISAGIDTGDIILRKPFDIESGDTLSSLREKAIIQGIEGLIEVAQHANLDQYALIENNSDHRQCYIMSRVIRKLTEKKLELIKRSV